MQQVDLSRQDAQQVAELALSLRNLSFLLSSLMQDEKAFDGEQFASSMFALHRQVDGLSERLQDLSSKCRVCINGSGTPGCPRLPNMQSFAEPFECEPFEIAANGKGR